MLKRITLGLTLTLACSTAATAGEDNGKFLHDANCASCHDHRIYTRPNRIVHSLEDLENRVKFCDTATQANFSAQDMKDVISFLNNTYYKFK